MNPSDILNFLTPDFSDLLQASFFCVMLAMLMLTIVSVSITASPRAWEKKWNHASNSKSGVSQGIEQGGVTDLFHIVATRPEKLAEVMPGMLLIVGLLGTFIGLGLALDKASSILGASNAMDAAGAADGLQNMLGMLKGLGTKFKTSTWGIAGFILMKVWSEVTQFEEKRLAWVIGKVKKETEARNALLAAADEEKWKKSIQLGSAMTSKLVAAFATGIEKSLQAAKLNNSELVANNAEFFTIQTSALSEQQKQIAQSNASTMREMIVAQAAAHALFDREARAAQASATERGERQQALLQEMSKQQAQIAQENVSSMGELFANHTKAINAQQYSQAQTHASWLSRLVDAQAVAKDMFEKQASAANSTTQSMSERLEVQLRALNQQAQENANSMSELFASHTKAINDQQYSQAQTHVSWLSQLVDAQAAAKSMFEKQANAANSSTKGMNERLEARLTDLKQQQATLAQQSTRSMTELFTNQTKALNEQQAQDMRENTRVITLLGDNMQRVADASQETNAAMQDFTKNTQTVVSNMDGAADRMATGAVSVGTAAKDLLGAVTNFEQQFTEVLNNVRTDLGSAITNMSTQASKTLEMGSQKLSDSTIQISKSLEQLSSDVTGTMTEVRKSIEQALKIQGNASNEIIASSQEFRVGILEITAKIENLTEPIEDGLRSIELSNKKLESAVGKVTVGLNSAVEINSNLSELISKISAFEGIVQVNEKLAGGLRPLTDIQMLLGDVRSKLANRPEAESGVASAINEKLTVALTPLKDIQSLLKEVRTELVNRPVPNLGVAPEALLRDFSLQIQQAFASAPPQQVLVHVPAPSAVLSE